MTRAKAIHGAPRVREWKVAVVGDAVAEGRARVKSHGRRVKVLGDTGAIAKIAYCDEEEYNVQRVPV